MWGSPVHCRLLISIPYVYPHDTKNKGQVSVGRGQGLDEGLWYLSRKYQ